MPTNKQIEEALDYLIDNVVMIKARMIRSGMSIDQGEAHNNRLKNDAVQALSELLVRERIDERNHLKRWWERTARVLNVEGNETVRNGQYIRVDNLEKANTERIAELQAQLTTPESKEE